MATSSVIKTALDALVAKRSVLSAGYQPITQNGARYQDLLSLVCSDDQKRQSPLVNAGYAVRLAVVTSTVHSFIQHHANQPIQLVILGCGLDVLGLWAHSIDPSNVTVYELDTPQISNTKKDLLLKNKLVVDLGSDGTLLKGRIADPADGDAASSDPNYHLFSCDLRKIETVEQCLQTLDRSKPTLVLSELVLTYLGRLAMDNLLQWCAENVCSAPGSCLASFETLGPKAPIRHSVLEGYKQQYCQQFVDKLSRGLAKFDPDDLFHPPGYDVTSVETRYRKAGFNTSLAALAGHAMRQTLHCQEPFDEHAALDLHLRSYVLVLGFPRCVDLGLVRLLCPWSSVVKHEFKPTTVQAVDGTDYTIRIIQAKDQENVRHLYRQTYEGLFEEYPSVRKMVKTGLKTDLSCNTDDAERDYSTIGSRFGMTGGVFLVAVDNDKEALLGCVGLRLCQRHERRLRGDHEYTFEIHRLAVDPENRGKGVGKMLMEALDTFVAHELGDGDSYGLVATTPALLSAANSLYLSCGFQVEKEEAFGKMIINTFSRL
jgi:O-methyltransferase involved in polyketide biosynthesis/GNAT superfamily N-acetyltransferase